MVLREGPLVKYDVEYVYELERYIYVKEGKTQFYPTKYGVTNDPKKRPARESICYLTPVFHDDKINKCFKNGMPTGKCPKGTITIKQNDYYGIA